LSSHSRAPLVFMTCDHRTRSRISVTRATELLLSRLRLVESSSRAKSGSGTQSGHSTCDKSDLVGVVGGLCHGLGMGEIHGPFVGTEAMAAGLATRRGLQRKYRTVYRNVYLSNDELVTPTKRAKAAWLWAGRDGTLGGLSAAAMHGARWIDPKLPAELFRHCDNVDGIVAHRDVLAPDEVCVIGGMAATTPARTAYDIGRRGGLTQAVMRLDALANATDLKPGDVQALVERHNGARGIVQLREAVDLMDGGAESPQETRTRLLLMAAGFPRPETQILICDEFGYLIGRVDMGWIDWKVAVEYDGPQHWASPADHARDVERIADLEAQGWTIIRVTRDILRYRPATFLARVRDAMAAAGWPHADEIRLDTHFPLDRVA
jgi:Protein of unknown function (DUF559)